MNHEYEFVFLIGNINKLVEHIKPRTFSDCDGLRVKIKGTNLFKYHAMNYKELQIGFLYNPERRQLYNILYLTEEQENKILTLLILGLELIDIVKNIEEYL